MVGVGTVDGPSVEALARVMVAAVAPEQLPTLRAVARDHRPGRARGDRSPLSFGPGEAVLLVAPIALAAATQVLLYVVEVVSEPVVERVVRRLSGVGAEDGPPDDGERAVLTVEQWQRVRQIVVRVAVESGLDEVRAGLMADAVVGRGQSGNGQ